MESNKRNLIIGYDLDSECSQISWFNEKKVSRKASALWKGEMMLHVFRRFYAA